MVDGISRKDAKAQRQKGKVGIWEWLGSGSEHHWIQPAKLCVFAPLRESSSAEDPLAGGEKFYYLIRLP